MLKDEIRGRESTTQIQEVYSSSVHSKHLHPLSKTLLGNFTIIDLDYSMIILSRLTIKPS